MVAVIALVVAKVGAGIVLAAAMEVERPSGKALVLALTSLEIFTTKVLEGFVVAFVRRSLQGLREASVAVELASLSTARFRVNTWLGRNPGFVVSTRIC